MRTISVLDQPLRIADTDATCWSPGEGTADFWETFEQNKYEPGTVRRMRRLLKPGSLFIDIGAWIGPFTLLALSLGCKVIAFEPDPVAFGELQANTDLNKGDFILFNAAVVPDGDVSAYSLNREDGMGLSELRERQKGLYPVATMTLERLAKLLPVWAIGFPETPGFVKIDVEGFETTLMPSLGPWLAKNKVATQVSLHGEPLAPASMRGFKTVIWPENNSGDVVALPFATMDPRQWA